MLKSPRRGTSSSPPSPVPLSMSLPAPFVTPSLEEIHEDSPEVRARLKQATEQTQQYGERLREAVKTAQKVVAAERALLAARSGLLGSLASLEGVFETEDMMRFRALKENMGELNDLEQLQAEQLEQVFIAPVEGLLRVLDTLKERSKTVSRARQSYDLASDKYAQLHGKKKSRQRARQALEESKSVFRTSAFDYTIWLSSVQSTMRSRLLKQTAMLWFGMRTFHNSADRMLRALEPFAQEVSSSVFEQENVDKSRTLKQEQRKHALLQQRSSQGYLWKRSGSRWVRGYYRVQDGMLDGINLVCALVKDDEDTCFRLVFPPDKELVLQATNQQEKEQWMASLEAEIERLLNATVPGERHGREADNEGGQGNLRILYELDEGNRVCVDCGAPEPVWGAINLGILFCINCSGAHRSLGVHVSKVRSFRLDAWTEEDMELMKRLGNSAMNELLQTDDASPPPTPETPFEERKAYVRAKYSERRFLKALAAPIESLDAELFEAIKRERPLPQVMELLLRGAEPNYHSKEEAGTTPLLWACQHQDVALASLLLYHGANVDERDDTQWAPIHTAANKGNISLISVLLSKGADLDARDENERNAEQVAVEAEMVEAVTYLRLARAGVSGQEMLKEMLANSRTAQHVEII